MLETKLYQTHLESMSNEGNMHKQINSQYDISKYYEEKYIRVKGIEGDGYIFKIR